MLTSLSIENFAIIESLAIDFQNGLTVLSGETGAGKSIIIDALGILCGARGSVDYIRQGASALKVEGLFTFEKIEDDLLDLLAEFGLAIEPPYELLIRREINQSGRNLIRINGQLATVAWLKEVGAYLVDIHGQNEHQALLDVNQHIHLLDQFIGRPITSLLEDYQTAYDQLQADFKAYQLASQDENQQVDRLNFLDFQLQDLEKAQLQPGEEEALQERSRRLQNQQKIQANLQAASYLLSRSENSVISQLGQSIDHLDQIVSYHESYPDLLARLKELEILAQEITYDLAKSQGDFEGEEDQIDQVEGRLAVLSRLSRKYRQSIDDLIDYQEAIQDEIYQIQHRDQYLEDLKNSLRHSYQKARALADQMHGLRMEARPALKRAVESQLLELYMAQSRFEVQLDPPRVDAEGASDLDLKDYIPIGKRGYDQVEFYVSTNLGEASHPLVRVASGGELSRYILALKAVFSQDLQDKVMVFDEIDTGVSGRVAQAIAEKIKSIAQSHQVLAITHLAQVAASADRQIYIFKEEKEGRTVTFLKPLDVEERIDHLAQMMAGKDLSPASLDLARDLLAQNQSGKEAL